MSTARTFVRLALGGLFVGSLAMACVVEDGGDDDDLASTPCEDGDFRDCACPDGETGRHECNASNTGFGSCQCEGSPTAGSSNGGSANHAGEGNTTAGTNNTNYGGEGTMGGAPAETGGAPTQTGGAPAETGGAGGTVGEEEPLECQDPADDCEACYFSCCDDWVACFNDATCLEQFNDILVCIDGDEVGTFVVDDLKVCADGVGSAGGPWSDGLDPKTVAMINCLGGDPSSPDWADAPMWAEDSCNNLCFNVN
ncbi:MAG TPA: hypothetical protein VJN18_21475 [Polyangiaceae bacterium]|nr:hypothetical protein [Polyangiaceae bacterium]